MRSISAHPCSRRAVLRGLGAAVALPWMESLPLCAGEPTPAAPGTAPTRLLVAYTGNGFHSKEWWAKGEGSAMELGKILVPLLPWRDRLVFVRGLYNEAGARQSREAGHQGATGGLLSGATLGKGEVRSGTSFDQVVAQRIGAHTRLPSLVVGCEEAMPGAGGKDYSMMYCGHISWSSPISPTALEVRPALVFDQLFRTAPAQSEQGIIDLVLGDAKRMAPLLSRDDRHRFDEYLQSVHEIEARIGRAAKEPQRSGWRPTLDKPDMPRPADGIPQDMPEYFRLMCDLVVLAFQTDTTRVASLKFNNDHGAHRYPHLGVGYIIQHLLSHQESPDLIKCNQWFVEQIAYLAKRMDAIREGERTLLDNTVILYLSSMINGAHDCSQLPAILVGGAGGRLKGGRVLDYLRRPERRMCSLYLRLMDYMGVELPSFGDAQARLTEI